MSPVPQELRFEPHDGFGHEDPDGVPYPFGYISDAQPIFGLNVILQRGHEELVTLALQMAASPKMLDALQAIAEGEWDEGNPNAIKTIRAIALDAISAATQPTTRAKGE
jgi:hypothetical protein